MMKAGAFIALLGTASASSEASASQEQIRHYYTYLGDISPAESSVGWASFTVDRDWYTEGFKIEGQTYATGVFAHAPSSIVYDLGSRYTKLTGSVGLNDDSASDVVTTEEHTDCKQNTQIAVTIYTDSKDALTETLDRSAGKFIHQYEVDLTTISELKLVAQIINQDDACVNKGGVANLGAEVAWVNAKLEENGDLECMDLGDILPEASSTVGWGSYWVNKNWYQSGFMINKVRYSSGVFAHAPSTITYDLASRTSDGTREWAEFSFLVGIDDNSHNDCNGKANDAGVVFSVEYGEKGNRQTWKSDTVNRNEAAFAHTVKLTDTATSSLVLKTERADGQSTGCDETEWVNARICLDRRMQNCVMSEWTNWNVCDRSCGSGTKKRTRNVQQRPRFGGALCPITEDVARCNEQPCPIDCTHGEWSSFTEGECDRSCGGGHRYRFRAITRHSAFGGADCGATKGTETCNQHACPEDCQYAKVASNGADGQRGWGVWTECSKSCGTGTQARTRTIKLEALFGGRSCASPTQQTRECNSHSCPVDCEAGAWKPFNTCSATCGTGFQVRKRSTDCDNCKTAEYGGKQCPEMTEVKECGKHPCPIDCEVSSWSAAHACTHTCGQAGTQIRHRSINVHPGYGGQKCGHLSETTECGSEACPVDCLVSSFGLWTTCSRSCGGGEHARRRSVRRATQQGGKECPHLLEMRKCNKHECPINCELGAWDVSDSDWTNPTYLDAHCSRTCTSGTTTGRAIRTRDLKTQASFGGKACGVKQHVTIADEKTFEHLDSNLDFYQWKSCNSKSCPSNCEVSDWELHDSCYGVGVASIDCVGASGNGFRKFTRSITSAAHFGGNQCPPLLFEAPCPVNGQSGPWGKTDGKWDMSMVVCDAALEASTGIKCMDACPVDCEMSPWSDWTVCDKQCGGNAQISGDKTSVSGEGYQKRTREVWTNMAHNGKTCVDKYNGGLKTEYQTCNTHDCPIDCVMDGQWTWGDCSATCGVGTQTGTRTITTQAQNDGLACGATTRTRDCITHVNCPIDCVYSEWSAYGTCDADCFHPGSTLPEQTRTRTILVEGNAFGTKCTLPLIQDQNCNEHKCPNDCQVAAWDSANWGECSRSCGHGIQIRTREVANQGSAEGTACGSTVQARTCKTAECPVDCAMTEWSQWDTCSEKCGQGFQYRTRTILGPLVPLNGGKVCGEVQQMQYCNEQACPVDCAVSTWASFGSCNTLDNRGCGRGSETRSRTVSVAAQNGGKSCPALDQYKDCEETPCQIDCEYAAWTSKFSECSRTCGYGTKVEHRAIKTAAQFGGEACVDSKLIREEACNEGACPGECQLNDDGKTEDCSKTCGEGVTTFTATLKTWAQADPLGHSSEANYVASCAKLAPTGTFTQSRKCYGEVCPVDCQYSAYTLGECTTTCGAGKQVRTRTIVHHAMGAGAQCDANTLTDVVACEVSAQHLEFCPIDCTYDEWEAWSACSVTCNGDGQTTRLRPVKAAAKYGGKACSARQSRIQTKKCNSGPCPVKCTVTAYPSWNTVACSKSCGGGKQTRYRTIESASQYGGTVCPNLSETQTCKEQACPIDCVVSAFSNFGACTESCGNSGEKTRDRHVLNTGAYNSAGKQCPPLVEIVACNRFRCDDTTKDINGYPAGNHAEGEDGLPIVPTRAPTTLKSFEELHKDVVEKGKAHELTKTNLLVQQTPAPTHAPTENLHQLYCNNGDLRVPLGWHGAGNGDNFCNLCKCTTRKGARTGHDDFSNDENDHDHDKKARLQCQQKSCSVYTAGTVCKATTCRFMYSFDDQREIMQVTHNNMDGAYNKEETMGSHHRCAYKAPAADTAVAIGQLMDARGVGYKASAQNHCECLCYKPTTSSFQKDVKRHSMSKLVHSKKRGGLKEKQEKDAEARAAAMKKHTNSQTYWVGKAGWGQKKWRNKATTKGYVVGTTLAPTMFPTKDPTAFDASTGAPSVAPTLQPTTHPKFIDPNTDTWYEQAKGRVEYWKSTGLYNACIGDLETELITEWRNKYVEFKPYVDQLTWNGNVAKYHATKYGFKVLDDDLATTKKCTMDSDCMHPGEESKEDGDTKWCIKESLESGITKAEGTCSRWTMKASKMYMSDWCINLQAYNLDSFTCDSLDESSMSAKGFTDVTQQPSACSPLAAKNAKLQKDIRQATDHIKWNGGEPNTLCVNNMQRINSKMVAC